MISMGRIKNLIGQRFGRLVVESFSHSNKSGNSMWNCKCDCGNTKVVCGSWLNNGAVSSCGCYRKEKTALLKKSHGFKGTRLYNVWCNIKQRCNNPSYYQFEYYGGRGISICKEWNDSFQAFHDWAIENGYDENAKRGECTIDRIDVNGNYSPDNCRWVSMVVQNRNQRKRRKKDGSK